MFCGQEKGPTLEGIGPVCARPVDHSRRTGRFFALILTRDRLSTLSVQTEPVSRSGQSTMTTKAPHRRTGYPVSRQKPADGAPSHTVASEMIDNERSRKRPANDFTVTEPTREQVGRRDDIEGPRRVFECDRVKPERRRV